MTRQEIIRDIKKETGSSFPNISEIAAYMGVSRDRVRTEIVSGLECISNGKSRQYFVNDIADRIMSIRTI